MNYRETRNAYLNCEKRMFDGTGNYDTPALFPVDIDLTDAKVLRFDYALKEEKPEDKILHFYLDDYKFERVWNAPEKYLPLLSKFKAVLAPDFSMYTDFPKAVQIFNQYRRQWLGAYWQEHGLKVIPTVCWSTPDTFEWCFDGIPKNSVISVSTIGCFKNPENRRLFMLGWEECKRVLQPSEVLLYGKRFPQITFDGPMTVVSNLNLVNKAEKAKRTEKAANGQLEGQLMLAI